MVAYTIVEDAGHCGKAKCLADKSNARDNSELIWSDDRDVVAVLIDQAPRVEDGCVALVKLLPGSTVAVADLLVAFEEGLTLALAMALLAVLVALPADLKHFLTCTLSILMI